MDDEHPQEGHLLASVLEDNAWVVRLAPQAVGRHHHGQVVDVHLGDGHVGGLSEHLGDTTERKRERERERDRQTMREGETDRERESGREREQERGGERTRKRERESEKEREREQGKNGKRQQFKKSQQRGS